MRRKKDEGAGREGQAAPTRSTASAMITPLDIQQKEFQVSRLGGYRMRDVDEFLDQLTDAMTAVLAENERLRSGGAPIVGSPDLDEVARQADEIIQRARDEAARIVAEARSRTDAGAGSSGGAVGPAERAAVDAFLAQERQFLQRLAALVQEHADAVKGMARDVRRRSGPAATAGAAAAAATPASDRPERTDADADAEPSTGVRERRAPAAAEADASDGDTSDGDADDEVGGASGEADPDATRPFTPVSSRDAAEDEPIVVDDAEEPAREPARSRRDDDRDTSLRELFWGEEG